MGIARSDGVSLAIKAGVDWKPERHYNPPAELAGKSAETAAKLGGVPLEAIVSPAFRRVATGPYLVLESQGHGPVELLISPG